MMLLCAVRCVWLWPLQEVICGLLHQRGRGVQHAAVAGRLRVGHIPAGSTDAVAYT